ncbi:MAG: hypothetical protein AAFZ17_01075 [Cyanobacteria bacterium J06650_10]
MSNLDPSLGKDAELHQYATSDLSVEEKLASGASIDDLVAAGVLQDDYDPDSEEYDFTPLPAKKEVSKENPMSEEEFETLMAVGDWYNSGRYLSEDPSNKPGSPSEK